MTWGPGGKPVSPRTQTHALRCAYRLLDLVPKGRDEESLPHHSGWLRRRDEYAG
jgi:predicted dithiol-disulfide oxidoreductase (DUF899 family)